MDRDESRFVQSSRQMVTTGDLIDIRFQDEPRHKKPIGIYWAQSLAAVVSGQGADAPLAVWRLPSLIGAVLAVVLTAALTAPLVGAGPALMGGLLLAATLVLGAEARIAKTDALLLALIVAGQGVLARLHAGATGLAPAAKGRSWAWAFWLSVGAAVLVKGPIAPLVIGMTAGVVSLWRRRVDWLAPLAHWPSLLAGLAVFLPWLTAISIISGGDFWRASLGDDMLAKAASGVEGKGAPPGTYLGMMWLTLFPATLIVVPAMAGLWRKRAHPAVMFLIAWIVPTWVMFELVPTKLVHYTMPTYPALAVLAAWLWLGRDRAPGLGLRLGSGGTLIVALLLHVAVWVFARDLGTPIAALWPMLLGAVLAAVAGAAALIAMRTDFRWSAALMAALAGAVLHGAAFTTLARIPAIWPTEQIMTHAIPAALARGCAAPHLTGWGYNEPSLVVRAGRDTRLLSGEQALPDDVLADPCAVIALDNQRVIVDIPQGLTQIATFDAFSLGAGRRVAIRLYQPAGAP